MKNFTIFKEMAYSFTLPIVIVLPLLVMLVATGGRTSTTEILETDYTIQDDYEAVVENNEESCNAEPANSNQGQIDAKYEDYDDECNINDFQEIHDDQQEATLQPTFSHPPLPKTITVLRTQTGAVENICLETYVSWVVLAEVLPYFQHDALAAQAVAARTYIIHRVERTARHHRHPQADVCDNFACCLVARSPQAHSALWGEASVMPFYERVREAVEATQGYVIKYDNTPIDALFHASSPGGTENIRYVWGNTRPYLVAVSSPETRPEQHLTFSGREILDRVLGAGSYTLAQDAPTLGRVSRNSSGRVEYLYIYGHRICPLQLRSRLGFRSTNFTVTQSQGSLSFTITGHGHGVGMSQHGANAFALQGWDWQQILHHYYTGVELVKR